MTDHSNRATAVLAGFAVSTLLASLLVGTPASAAARTMSVSCTWNNTTKVVTASVTDMPNKTHWIRYTLWDSKNNPLVYEYYGVRKTDPIVAIDPLNFTSGRQYSFRKGPSTVQAQAFTVDGQVLSPVVTSGACSLL